MTRDALTPLTYPYDVVRVACPKCGREGRYPRKRIIARYGQDAEVYMDGHARTFRRLSGV
jgi:RNase P subunit RPR2